jgi:putative ABC transport system permease protein
MVAAAVQDVRFAFRLLVKRPRDTAISVAILALGIGANAVMFGALSHVLWRPFPFADESRLFRLREQVTGVDGTVHPFNMSSSAILGVRSAGRDLIDGLVAMSGENMALAGADGPERVSVVLQSDGFDQTLAVPPIAGRTFSTDESTRGIDAGVALISHATWETRFARSPAAIGSRVRLDGRVFTIVGVMPPQYAFPYDAQFWVPWRLDPADRSRDFAVWIRARTGVTRQQLRDGMTRVAAEIRRGRPDLPAGYGIEVRTIRENLVGDQDRPLVAVTAMVVFMVLIAAVNVATLLLARAVTRAREFAVRAALGQSRGRLIGQLLAESLALAAVGCPAGLLLASWLSPLTMSFVPRVLSGQLGLGTPKTDWRVALYAAAVSLASAAVAGVLPALATMRTDPQQALAGGRSVTSGRTSRSLLSLLVVAETALTLVLLAGAGAIVRNFVQLQNRPLGFEARGLLAIELTPPASAYADPARRTALMRQIVDEVSAVPGVVRAAVTTVNPLGGGTWGASIVSEEMLAHDPNAVLNVNHRLITPGLLETMNTPLVRGRGFSSQDRADTAPVVIVSSLLAHRLWPGGDPIGRRIRVSRPGSPWLTVVGVAGDVADANDPGVPPETWYVPYAQHAGTPAAEHVYVMIRDGGSPLALVPQVRRAIGRVDNALAPYQPVAMDAYRSESIGRERVSAAFMIGFGGFGLFLAALGVYGVVAFSVAERRLEFGIRIALGAVASDIVPLVMRRAVGVISAGLAVGALAAVLLTRALASLLPAVGGIDPLTLAVAAALMVAAAIGASLVPTLAAGRSDPVDALKGS